MQKLIDIYNKLQKEYEITDKMLIKDLWHFTIQKLNTHTLGFNTRTINDLLIMTKYHFLETLQKDDGFRSDFWDWFMKQDDYFDNICFDNGDYSDKMLTGFLVEYIQDMIK